MNENPSKSVLARLVEALTSRLPGLIAVYRFGSFGTPEEHGDSDIDLGVQADGPLDPVAVFQFGAELATLAGRDVDLVDMTRCSTVMRAQIVAMGELLFCRDSYRCENYATTAFSRYAHLNEARRGILDDIRARGSVYGR